MDREAGLASRAACPAPGCADESSEDRLGMHRGVGEMKGSDRNRSGEQLGEVGGARPLPLMAAFTLSSKVLFPPHSGNDLAEPPAKSTPTCLGDNGESVATPLNVVPCASGRDRSNEEIGGGHVAAMATPICASADFAQHAGGVVEPPH